MISTTIPSILTSSTPTLSSSPHLLCTTSPNHTPSSPFISALLKTTPGSFISTPSLLAQLPPSVRVIAPTIDKQIKDSATPQNSDTPISLQSPPPLAFHDLQLPCSSYTQFATASLGFSTFVALKVNRHNFSTFLPPLTTDTPSSSSPTYQSTTLVSIRSFSYFQVHKSSVWSHPVYGICNPTKHSAPYFKLRYLLPTCQKASKYQEIKYYLPSLFASKLSRVTPVTQLASELLIIPLTWDDPSSCLNEHLLCLVGTSYTSQEPRYPEQVQMEPTSHTSKTEIGGGLLVDSHHLGSFNLLGIATIPSAAFLYTPSQSSPSGYLEPLFVPHNSTSPLTNQLAPLSSSSYPSLTTTLPTLDTPHILANNICCSSSNMCSTLPAIPPISVPALGPLYYTHSHYLKMTLIIALPSYSPTNTPPPPTPGISSPLLIGVDSECLEASLDSSSEFILSLESICTEITSLSLNSRHLSSLTISPKHTPPISKNSVKIRLHHKKLTSDLSVAASTLAPSSPKICDSSLLEQSLTPLIGLDDENTVDDGKNFTEPLPEKRAKPNPLLHSIPHIASCEFIFSKSTLSLEHQQSQLPKLPTPSTPSSYLLDSTFRIMENMTTPTSSSSSSPTSALSHSTTIATATTTTSPDLSIHLSLDGSSSDISQQLPPLPLSNHPFYTNSSVHISDPLTHPPSVTAAHFLPLDVPPPVPINWGIYPLRPTNLGYNH